MPPQTPLSSLRIVLVGPGRVGWSLTRWAVDCGADLVGVVGRSRRRALERGSVSLDGLWCAITEFSLAATAAAGAADLLLVAVADPALPEVAAGLARTGARRDAATPVVLHTSGIHDAGALAPLAAVGCAVGSLHPLMAFPRVLATPGPRPPCFAVDGDAAALALARRLAHAFGGRAFEIAGRRRLLYHLAATVAAGGVTTLLAVVEDLLERAELPAELLPSYFDLAHGALDQAAATRPVVDAVTGPAARGDSATVQRQLAALDALAPELAEVVAAVHGETLRRRGT